MRVKTHLQLLIAAAVAPLVAFSGILVNVLLERDLEARRQSTMERTRALMSAIDAESRGHLMTIQAVASSSALAADDLPGFHQDAVRALGSQPNWLNVTLVDFNGRQLVNALRPYGSAIPATPDVDSVQRTLKAGKSLVGDVVAPGNITLAHSIPFRVPYPMTGQPLYAVSALVMPDAFAEILRTQRFPDSWTVAVLDSRGRFVARIPHRAPGELSAPGLRAAFMNGAEGWLRTSTLEGVDAYQAYTRSEDTGWGVAIAIPAAELAGPGRNAAIVMAIGALVALLLAWIAGSVLGQRLHSPMISLARGARALGRGERFRVEGVERVAEARDVAQALAEAAEAIEGREATLRSAEQALQEANQAKDRFLAMLSHELRNPLAAIAMTPHIIRKMSACAGADPVQTAAIIERQVANMSRLIEDLLDMSRITHGKLNLNRHAVDLGALAERIVATWKSAGRLSGRRLAVQTEQAWVSGDEARLERRGGQP